MSSVDDDKKRAAQKFIADRLESKQQLSTSQVRALLHENELLKRSIEANLFATTESMLKGADTTLGLLNECRESLPKVCC